MDVHNLYKRIPLKFSVSSNALLTWISNDGSLYSVDLESINVDTSSNKEIYTELFDVFKNKLVFGEICEMCKHLTQLLKIGPMLYEYYTRHTNVKFEINGQYITDFSDEPINLDTGNFTSSETLEHLLGKISTIYFEIKNNTTKMIQKMITNELLVKIKFIESLNEYKGKTFKKRLFCYYDTLY